MTEQQTEFRPLFGPKGEWLDAYSDAELFDSLSPERQRLYLVTRDAAHESWRAEADLQLALDRVAECFDHLRECERAMPPKRSFHSLWQETFGRPRNGDH